ncbi:DUF2490 domain-containing protein [Pontibacter harenae]|uniref:DUF2490 domain-containing protein n=1 Tax=Pontibacter harenae TaxID=2894083 RepID=UPI001E3CDE59|nr:DUF2490 domain-containing protein [Pontibacter harenae]MCC9165908.1 DUF2490 domain-containing protein [Pontibacter harenae]
MRKFYLIFLLVVLPAFSQAQRKVTAPTAIWPELQLSYGVSEKSLFFFRNQYRINTDSRFNDLKNSGPLSNFERVELTLGYEFTSNEHWRGGALVRYAIENYPKITFYTFFLRHNGHIGSLYFNKQGAFDFANQEDQDLAGRVRLMVELGKRLPIGSKYITPSIRYEIMMLTELGETDRNNLEERSIDRTRLRLSLNYELTEKLRINPYFMRQTDYYYAMVPPKYDENDVLLEDGYTTKRNRVSPVFGLEIKYNFNIAPNTASISY